MQILRLAFVLGFAASGIALACGGSDSSGPSGGAGDAGPRGAELTGQECKVAGECYSGVAGGADGGALKGAVICLDKVTNGYCTHLCATDADCCAVPGECKTGLKQVCAPFESTGMNMCFLSCEDADVKAGIAAQSGTTSALDAGASSDAYCQAYASAALGCRSTGGGKNNRKVCVP